MAASERERWNQRFSEPSSEFLETRPSPWLELHQRLLSQQPKGRALDVASGAGRNSFYLAELGFHVEAWDISDVAMERVTEEARRRRLPVQTRCCDLSCTALPTERFEVVVNINYLERSLFPGLEQSLVPGGLLLLETFTRAHAEVVGKHFNPAYLLEPDELRSAFPGLRVLDYREGILQEGQEDARAVASLVARRPRHRVLEARGPAGNPGPSP